FYYRYSPWQITKKYILSLVLHFKPPSIFDRAELSASLQISFPQSIRGCISQGFPMLYHPLQQFLTGHFFRILQYIHWLQRLLPRYSTQQFGKEKLVFRGFRFTSG